MISAPTDRLHKFLAIVGLLLLAFGVKTGIDSYHEAAFKRIEFMESFRPANDAYGDYAKLVNEAIDLHNRWVLDPSDKNRTALRSYLARIKTEEKELLAQAKALDNANITDLDSYKHHDFMRNIWLAIAAVCISIGSIVSYIGFRQWFKQPKRSR